MSFHLDGENFHITKKMKVASQNLRGGLFKEFNHKKRTAFFSSKLSIILIYQPFKPSLMILLFFVILLDIELENETKKIFLKWQIDIKMDVGDGI